MKKLYKFSAFAALLMSVGLASCNHEEADIFEHSAAQRTEEARKMYNDILVDKGGKWQMEYYTTEEEPGYIYLFTFRKDGSVTISGHNKYINMITSPDARGSKYGSETSMWTILSDNGPVLSFNTYNSIFHLFASPEDIPDTERDEQGYGHDGDYEFDLMKYSGDTLYLEGKKNGADIIMTRVAADVDDEVYMNEVVALADSFFNAKIPTVYVNLPGGYRHVVLDGASQLPKFYPETGDYITEWVGRNAIITHDGFTLGKPLTLRDSIDGNDYTIQHFIRQKDGSLLCSDDGKTTITADALNAVATDKQLKWQVGTEMMGELKAAYDAFVAQTKAKNYTLRNVQFLTAADKSDPQKYELLLKFRTKSGSTVDLLYYYHVTLNGKESFNMVFDGTSNSNGASFKKTYTTIADFIDKLQESTFTPTSSSRLAPITMKWDAGNNGYFVVDVQ